MRVLITAGPTREPLDPVRYLTNRSSGRMGYALAHAFADAGHQVLLVSGPTDLDVPPGVDFVPVETAVEMHDAVARHLPRMDAAVFAAAVADYRPATVAERKIKKTGDTLTLELVRNPDILGDARGAMGFGGVLVGFAAETESLEANARDKLSRKRCDLIVANDVSRPGIGFDSDRNELLLVFPDRAVPLPEDEKHHLAHRLVHEVEALAAGTDGV
jgi:phosphopantothenoylcysteine decarboxylase/phosphopantothenate--cysteine ligase